MSRVAYFSLGMVANPFKPFDPTRENPVGVLLTTHAAVSRLARAFAVAAEEERSRVIWVEKPKDVHEYFHSFSLAEALESFTSDELFGILPAYVQLQSMKGGRVRSALGGVAEKVAGADFDLTLAAWTRSVLRAPDHDLPEWAPLEGKDLGQLIERLEQEPAAAASDLYGPLEAEREGVRGDLEVMLRVAQARMDRTELDPEVSEEIEEDEVGDQTSEIFATPLGERAEAVMTDDRPVSEGGPAHADVVAYVIAHTRAHLSPVVARGIKVYVAQGTSALSQELKITKAPRKTLGAIGTFTRSRCRKVAIVWDRFSEWERIAQEDRSRVIGALTEVRWALADAGVSVILANSEEAPDLAEQFAAAEKVVWDMPRVGDFERAGLGYDEEVIRGWIASATMPDASPMSLDSPQLAALRAETADSLDLFCAAAAAAVDSAALRGASELGDEDVAVGLAAAAAAQGGE